MKKVDIFIPYLSGYGGTEVVIHNLLKEYHKQNNDFKIMVYSLGGFLKNNYLKSNDVKIVKFPNNKLIREFLYIFLLPFMIPYFVWQSKPNVFISTTPVMWTIAKIAFKLFNIHIPVVAWYHYSFTARHVKRFYLTKPDYFLSISKSGKRELINKGVLSNKIFVIYNPIFPSKHTIYHSKGHNQFIFVGRIEYGGQKNLQEMFRALSKIHKPWDLNIYGHGTHEDIKQLKQLSIKLKINNKIHYKGFVHNVFNHINNADALLLTSTYEGFPMVIAEALSHGLYVISSDCPDGPSELIDGQNGSLYNMHNVHELYLLINKVLLKKNKYSYNRIKSSISNLYVRNYVTRVLRSIGSVINDFK